MILPTKHLQLDRSLLIQGSELLESLHQPQTVNRLWSVGREDPGVRTFDQFCLALSFLYAIGLIEFEDGLVARLA